MGVHHQTNRGIAAGWKSGALAANGQLVAIIDADLQYQPEDLLRMRRELYEYSVDIVQGWRSPVGRRRDKRYYLSRGLNVLLNAVFSMHLQDNKSGFLLCSREVFLDLLSYRGNYFYWQSFVMVAAHSKGYSYREIETLFEERRQGESFLDTSAYRASLKNGYDILKAAWEYRVGRPPPDVATQFLRRHRGGVAAPQYDPLRSTRWRTYLASFNATHQLITRDVEHYHETLTHTQWLSSDQLLELQNEKLRRLIRHAYRNVPYYRTQMQRLGLKPADIRGRDDLHKLPVLTKADVRRHLHFDIMSTNHDKDEVLGRTTSGSTGEPFVCYADRAQMELCWAAALRGREWTGYRFGDAIVDLWPRPLHPNELQRARAKLDDKLTRRTCLPSAGVDAASLRAMVNAINAAKPVLITGSAENLVLLAHFIAQGQASLTVQPRALQSSGQTLTAADRTLVEEAFGCALFDSYGSRELPAAAYECEHHDGYHIMSEGYLVEVLVDGRAAAPGERGQLVVTDLNNYCMPFIRYQIGDSAEAVQHDPCGCGRGGRRIRAIEGRRQTILVGVGGRHLPGTFLSHYLRDFHYAIRRFAVTQTRPGQVLLSVVPGGRFSEAILRDIANTLQRQLGDSLVVEVKVEEEVAAAAAAAPITSSSVPLALDFGAQTATG